MPDTDPNVNHVANATAALDDAGAGPNLGDVPEDYGAELIAQFEHRTSTLAASGEDGMTPPGGWPGGTGVDALAQLEANATPVPREDAPAEPPAAETAPETATASESDASAVPPPAGASAPNDAPADGAGGQEPAGGLGDGTSPSGYVWEYADNTGAAQQAVFPDEVVQRALSLDAWAQQLPDATRAAFGAIEQGQAVAIPRADYDRFVAWQNQQQTADRDADLAEIAVDNPALYATIKAQRDKLDALGSQQGGQGGLGGVAPQPAPLTPQADANLNATATAFDTTIRSYAQEKQLSQPEIEALAAHVVQEQILPFLMERNTLRNQATGAVLRDPDPSQVMRQALDFALTRNPALHTAVLSRAATPATTSGAPTSPAVTDPVTAKKARAASVATAASTAVPPNQRTIRQLSDKEVMDAMTAEIAAALSAGA